MKESMWSAPDFFWLFSFWDRLECSRERGLKIFSDEGWLVGMERDELWRAWWCPDLISIRNANETPARKRIHMPKDTYLEYYQSAVDMVALLRRRFINAVFREVKWILMRLEYLWLELNQCLDWYGRGEWKRKQLGFRLKPLGSESAGRSKKSRWITRVRRFLLPLWTVRNLSVLKMTAPRNFLGVNREPKIQTRYSEVQRCDISGYLAMPYALDRRLIRVAILPVNDSRSWETSIGNTFKESTPNGTKEF